MKSLPRELVVEIFCFLGSYRNCVFLCGSVCKEWRGLLSDEKNYGYLREFGVHIDAYKKSWQYRLPYSNAVMQNPIPFSLNNKQQQIHFKFLDFLDSHDKILDMKSDRRTGKSLLLRVIGISLTLAIPYTVIMITIGKRQKKESVRFIQKTRGFVPANMQIVCIQEFSEVLDSLIPHDTRLFLLFDEVHIHDSSIFYSLKSIKKSFLLNSFPV